MSLPSILGTTLESIPATVPYLTPPSDTQLNLAPVGSGERVEEPDTTQLKVGLVWSGGHLYKKNQEPIVSSEAFCTTPATVWHCLLQLAKRHCPDRLI